MCIRDRGTYKSLTRPDAATREYTAAKATAHTQMIGQYASGKNYSPQGLALIHEKGGEIRKLSSGETIIPADKSKQLIEKAGNGDVKVYVTIQGNVIGNEEYADYVGNHIGTKIKLALGNM